MERKTKPVMSKLRLPFFKRWNGQRASSSASTDISADPFILFDKNLDIVGMNPLARSLFHLILGENVISEDILNGAPNVKHDNKNNGRHGKYLNAIRKGKPLFVDSIVIHSGFLDISLRAEAFKVGKGFGIIFSDLDALKKAEETQYESKEGLTTNSKSAPDCIFIFDLKGIILHGSRWGEKLTGYPWEEIKGKSFLEIPLFAPEYLPKAAQLLELSAEGKSTGPDEFELIRKDGSRVSVEISTCPIGRGEEIEVIGIARDITERKQSEEALRQSEERYRAIVETSLDGIYQVDTSGKFTFINEAFANTFGYGREELLGKHFSSLLSIETFPKVKEMVEEVFSGKNVRDEVAVQHKDGHEVVVTFSTTPLKDRGKIIGLTGILRDVTERKRMEEALAKSEARYRSLIETAGAGVATIDLKGELTLVNEALCRMIGYPQEELLGRNFADFLHLDDKENALDIFTKGLERETEHPVLEFRGIHKDGHSVWCYSSPSPIVHDNELIGFNAIIHDITERKKAEEALRESEQRFRNVLDNSLDMVYRLNLQTGTYDYVSLSTEKILGYSAEEFVGFSIEMERSLAHPDDLARLDENVIELVTSERGTVSSIEYRIKHKELGYRWVSDSRSVVYDDANNPVAVVGTVRDINERKKEEEALRESEEKYRLLAENVTDVIWTMDMDLRFTYISPSVMCLRGLTVEEAMAERLEDIFSPSSFQALVEAFEEGIVAEATGLKDPSRSWTLELEEYCKDGSLIWVDIRAGLLRDQDGRPVGLVGVTRDITKRKKLEELEKRRTHDLDLLSKAAVSLVELYPDADIHHFLAERLLEFAEGSVVLVSSFDEFSDTFCVREALGIGEKMEALIRILGRNLIGMHVPSGKWKQSPALGDLGKVPGGTYELASGAVPMPVCQEIEKLLDVGNVYAIDLTWEGKLYGSAVIGTRSGTELENTDIIQTFVGQASIALQRRKAEEALRESRNYLENLLDYANAPIIVWNEESKITRFNCAFEHLTGYTAGQVIGHELRLLFPETSRQQSLDEISRTLAGEHWKSVEIPILRTDGGVRFVLWNSANIYAGDGVTLIATIAQGTDITERKKAEEALRESEEKYRALVDTAGLAGEGIMIVERAEGNKATITFVNDTLSGMLGYQREEMPGMSARDLFLPGDRMWLQERNRRRRKGESLPSHYGVMALRKDGSMLPIEISMGAMRYEGKSATVIYVRDVTERKQAEEALRESEAQFRAIFDGAAIGVGLLDVDGQPFRINPALREMLGYTLEELRSTALTEYLHPDDAKVDLILFREMVGGKRDHYEVEKRFIRKDGQMVWGLVTLSAVRGMGGKLQFAIGMIEDITERQLALANLKISEKYFRALIENASEGIVVVSKDGTIKSGIYSVSPPRGYKPEEVIGTNGFSEVHPEDIAEAINAYNELMQNPGMSKRTEMRVRHKDGSWRNFEVIARNLLDDPIVEGIVANYHDITGKVQAHEELLRHTKRVEVLHAISQAVSQTLELEELLNTALEKVIEVMNVEAGCVYLLDMVENELVLKTYVGVPEEVISQISIIKLSAENIQKMLQWDGELSILPEIFGDAAMSLTSERLNKAQIQSFAVTPFAVRGQLSGLIAVGNRAHREFSPSDIDLLRAVGNQIGIGAQNAVLYEEVRALIRETIDAQEKERERICLEVHDGVAQTLVAAFQYLQALEATAPDDAQTKKLLAKTSAQVKQAIQESREVINSLQPATLSDLGLISTLRQELKRLGQETGLKIDFKADALRLPKDVEVGLYRIIREAIFNARKHANTKQLRVKINSEDGGVKVEVRDWGKGFDQAYLDRARRRGTGLFSIRKRAELLQGTCEIQSKPGEGTTVRVDIPFVAAT